MIRIDEDDCPWSNSPNVNVSVMISGGEMLREFTACVTKLRL